MMKSECMVFWSECQPWIRGTNLKHQKQEEFNYLVSIVTDKGIFAYRNIDVCLTKDITKKEKFLSEF